MLRSSDKVNHGFMGVISCFYIECRGDFPLISFDGPLMKCKGINESATISRVFIMFFFAELLFKMLRGSVYVLRIYCL